jgi:hypothetical protein
MNKELVVRAGLDIASLGDILAKSGYFQDTRDAAQAIVKVLAGQELGFGPVASMTGVYIVKGKVSLSANLMGAAVKRSGRYNYRVLELTDEAAEIEFFEDGKGIGRSRFTLQDAQKAGLNGSDNWRKYPRNMLFARALSNGVKWYCPDVTGGPAYTPDELGAVVDEDGEVIEAEVVERPTPPIHQPVADQSRRIQTGPVQPPPEPPAQPDNGHEAVPLKPSEVDALIEYARTLRPDLKDAVRAHLSNSCLKACGLTDWTDAMLGGLEQAKSLVADRALEKAQEAPADAEAAKPARKAKK